MIRKVVLIASLSVLCLFSCEKPEVLQGKDSTEVSNELLKKQAIFSEKDQIMNNTSDRQGGAEFRGIFLGQNVVFSEKDNVFKNISGLPSEGDPHGEYTTYLIGNRIYRTEINDQDYTDNECIQIGMGMFKAYTNGRYGPDSVYTYLKRVLKVGVKKQSFANIESGYWNIVISPGHMRPLLWKNIEEGAHIEILEVREVDTKTITTKLDINQLPYYPKAFWVTYKIKASFEDYGDIDGILKVKYLINRFYSI